MLTTGVYKIIEVKRTGTTKDGRKYVHCLAVDFFNQGDKETGKKGQFVTLKAFGSTAEFIERNVNSIRRAYISGELSVDTYMDKMEVTKTITFNGTKGKVKFNVDVPKTSLSLDVQNIRFLDKPNEKSDEIAMIADDSDEATFIVEDEETDAPRGSYSEDDEVAETTVDDETTVDVVTTDNNDDAPVIGRKRVRR